LNLWYLAKNLSTGESSTIGVEWSGRDEDAVREAMFCERMGLDISGEKYLREVAGHTE
jgi:hypothetical protein